MEKGLVKMTGISKVYDNGVVANRNVNFMLYEGEIHALAGENGAGKSTLMKILYGMEKPQAGSIVLNGSTICLRSPADALQLGLGMVHQHFMLVESLTVAENVILGIEPVKRFKLDIKKANRLTRELAEKYQFNLSPRACVQDVSVGSKQKIEILKVLARGAKIIILDEPTAVLTPQETREFFKQLIILKKNGISIIIITHKLNEIKEICDRVTVMRNGSEVGVFQVNEITTGEISRLMVGRDIVSKVEKSPVYLKGEALRVEDVYCINDHNQEVLKGVSFSVKKGCIVGLAGVEGNGQRELIQIITGINQNYEGNVLLCGQNIRGKTIKAIRNLGLSHIPEDRMTLGVNKEASILDNLISLAYDQKELNQTLLLNWKEIRKRADRLINDFVIKCKSSAQTVKMLSGGNIQKVVCAREIDAVTEFLVADQPSRGVDIGAAAFIHSKLLELRDRGKAILLVSADLNEVLSLSDHLMVMYGGEITAYFNDISALTEEDLGFYMLGLKKQPAEQIRMLSQ